MATDHVLILSMVISAVLLIQTVRSQEPDQLPIVGSGATFPGEVFEAWTSSFEGYRSQFRNIDMRYSATGSSVGKILIQDEPSEELTYAGTDSEMTGLEYLGNPDLQMVPILAGSIVLAFNLPSIDIPINLTREHIVGIYNGTYQWWNESSIQDINSNVSFPQRRIRVVARADYSGTTEVFTASLCNFDPNWNTTYGKFPEGLNNQEMPIKWNNSAIDLYGRLNRGVSGIILSYSYSLGYLSVADAVITDMTIVRILDDKYGILIPSYINLRKAMERSVNSFDDQLTADLNDFVDPDEYPIIGYSYLIIRRTEMPNCDQAVELVRYIEWTFTDTFSTEQIVDFRMSSVTERIAFRIQEEVFQVMQCGGGQSVWSLVQAQKERERKLLQKWRIPVFVTVPIIGTMILAMIIYMVVQQIRLRRALLSDEWKIEEEKIHLTWSRKYGLVANKDGPGSLVSLNMSTGSNASITAGAHVWGIGAWGDKNICLRQLPTYAIFNIQNKETRKTLVWMKYKVIQTNVLRLYGATFVDQELFIVSEHAQKGTLSDVIQNDKYRIDDNIKFALASDLASGMNYLHGLGIIHSRLCSECCYVDHRWNVKIADWEYYLIEQNRRSYIKKTSSSRVTPVLNKNHISEPEDPNIRARMDFFVDPNILKYPGTKPNKSSNVYSCGIILVEIFTRDDPYSELSALMDPVDVIHAIKEKDIRPVLSDISPPAIQPIIRLATDKEPTKRPTFVQLQKLLKAAKPSKKSVMDSMMEVLEGYVNQLEEKVSERTAALASANSSLEHLLHQILPPSVADSLSRGESVQPESFDSVTIFFSDIVGFTSLSSSSTPFEVVEMLNDLYTAFDAIIDNHDVYKVETIGDAYMVISGLPNRNGNMHASHICTMALDLMAAASDFKIRHRPDEKLKLRAGIHTGSVVSGVVGLKMPRYCLFGDTVNTASRMESTSVAMQIQISQTTHDLLSKIGGFKTEPRGELDVKGKGTMMTYFLLSREGYQPLHASNLSSKEMRNNSARLTPREVGLFPKTTMSDRLGRSTTSFRNGNSPGKADQTKLS